MESPSQQPIICLQCIRYKKLLVDIIIFGYHVHEELISYTTLINSLTIFIFFYEMEIVLRKVLSSVWQILTTKSMLVVTIIINFNFQANPTKNLKA